MALPPAQAIIHQKRLLEDAHGIAVDCLSMFTFARMLTQLPQISHEDAAEQSPFDVICGLFATGFKKYIENRKKYTEVMRTAGYFLTPTRRTRGPAHFGEVSGANAHSVALESLIKLLFEVVECLPGFKAKVLAPDGTIELRASASHVIAYADPESSHAERTEAFVTWRMIIEVFRAFAFPDEEGLRVEITWEHANAMPSGVVLNDTPTIPEDTNGKAMSVEEANKKARKVAKQYGKAFFVMSERQQVEQIGCHRLTYKQTEFYLQAVKEGDIVPAKPKAARADSLTSGREAVIGTGEKNEILNQAIEREQEAQKLADQLELHRLNLQR